MVGGPEYAPGRPDDEVGGGRENTTMQLSYRSIAVVVEPTIHEALESTVSPITATMSTSIVDDLIGLKVPGSVYDVRSVFESPSKLVTCRGEKESLSYVCASR